MDYGQNKSMSKPKIIAAATSGITYLFVTVSVFAQNQGLKAPGGSLAANTKVEAIPQYIVNMMFLIAAFLAVAYLMFGGIKWITSRGDKIAVEAARKHIVAAVIGLVIVAGSFFALNVVFRLLGADNPLEEGFKFQTIQEVNESIE
jgi:succinate dehydrogenase/fumarate reductase cytochrome b subunit